MLATKSSILQIKVLELDMELELGVELQEYQFYAWKCNSTTLCGISRIEELRYIHNNYMQTVNTKSMELHPVIQWNCVLYIKFHT